MDQSLLDLVPPAILHDIVLNYQDEGTDVTFRNIVYRLLALKRNQHVSATLASHSADDMLELHGFLFQVRRSYLL